MIRNKLTSCIALSFILTGCGSEEDNSTNQNASINLSESTQLSSQDTPIDPNLDSDNDGWTDEFELNQGSDPYISNLVTVYPAITESFQEIQAADTSIVDDTIFNMVSRKQSDRLAIQWQSYSGSPLYDDDMGESIFGDMTLSFSTELLDAQCTDPKLDIRYMRSSGSGTRTIEIYQESDGLRLKDLTGIGSISSFAEEQFPLNITSTASDNIIFVGQRMLLNEVSLSATCLTYDTDLDGLIDELEITHGSDIHNPDSDADGLSDYEEVINQLNPLDPIDGALTDTDNDGLNNAQEIKYGFNPTNPNDGAYADSDHDTMTNLLEIENGLNPNQDDAQADNDSDGLTNVQEVFNALNPLDPSDGTTDTTDSDNDGWFDIFEQQQGSDPLTSNKVAITRSITENFQEIQAPDSSSVNDTIFAMVSRKESNPLALQWQTYSGNVKYDDDNGESIFHNMTLSFNTEIYYADCQNPKLDISYQRSSSSGTRSIEVYQESDGLRLKPTTDIRYITSLITETLPLSITSAVNDSIVIVGKKLLLNKLTLSATCSAYDTDLDGLIDELELVHGTDKLNPDTDNDGLSDYIEINNGLNPLDPSDGATADTDGDGINNLQEINHGLDPFNHTDGATFDTDNDGITNLLEIENGLDPLVADADLDNDNDGLTNLQEVLNGLNPHVPSDGYNADSDNDGYSNGYEIENQLDPLFASGPNGDSDNDGISNQDEIANGSNPNDDKIQLPDSLTVTLNDGVVVNLSRFSLRSEKFTVNLYDPAIGTVPMDYVPEVRSFRGKVDGIEDSTVIASIRPSCEMYYHVFYGYNAKPNRVYGADVSFGLESIDLTLQGACQPTTSSSNARYQQGDKLNLSDQSNIGGWPEIDRNYWPKNGSEYHFFEFSLAMQIAYSTLMDTNGGDILDAVAFADHQMNVLNHAYSRQFNMKAVMSDLVIETDGVSKDDAPEDRAEYSKAWNDTNPNFWQPRREQNYYYEHLYFVIPKKAYGLAWGTRAQCTPSWASWCMQHELGHNRSCTHNCFPDRYNGVNPMAIVNGVASAPLNLQNQMARDAANDVRGGKNMLDLRVPYANWPTHPVAQPDKISMQRDTSRIINVLANDEDPNNEAMQVTHVELKTDSSSNGADNTLFIINTDNTITATPPNGFSGFIDAFYVVEDSAGMSTRGILRINVETTGISNYYNLDHHTCGQTTDNEAYPLLSELTAVNPLAHYVENTNCDAILSSSDNGEALTQVQLIQYPKTINNIKQEAFTPVWEVNDLNFSFSLRFKYQGDGTSTYRLASRGTYQDSGYEHAGWTIKLKGDKVVASMTTSDREVDTNVLVLDPVITSITDSSRWQHLAITIDWDVKLFSLYHEGNLVDQLTIPDYFLQINSGGTKLSYRGGAPAKVGDIGFNVDDIIVAHEAFTAQQIQTLAQQEYPALTPQPLVGETLDTTALNTLSWQLHNNMLLQFKSFDVYLSQDPELVKSSAPETLIADAIVTTDTLVTVSDVGSYYWRVDLRLQDDSVITGDLWSFNNSGATMGVSSMGMMLFSDYNIEADNTIGELGEFDMEGDMIIE